MWKQFEAEPKYGTVTKSSSKSVEKLRLPVERKTQKHGRGIWQKLKKQPKTPSGKAQVMSSDSQAPPTFSGKGGFLISPPQKEQLSAPSCPTDPTSSRKEDISRSSPVPSTSMQYTQLPAIPSPSSDEPDSDGFSACIKNLEEKKSRIKILVAGLQNSLAVGYLNFPNVYINIKIWP